MKFQKLLSVVAALLTSTLFFQAQAQYPVVIPYQGTISDTGGTPYDGTFDFKFELKDKFGAIKWSSGVISLDVNLGAYSVDLGASPQPAIWDTCFKQDSLELLTSFDDGTNGMETLMPSVKLKPVPYSVHSRFADVYCGDSLHTTYIHSYWIHGYWFWGYWAVFDSIYVKKVVVDSLFVKHLITDTIVVDVICTKKIKLDDPVTGENTIIEPDGISTSKMDPVTKETEVSGVFPEGIVVAKIDSTGKILDSTIITSTTIKTKIICADSIKTEDPVSGAITSMTSKGISVKDSLGHESKITPETVETGTLKADVLCADSIKGPKIVITDPNNPDNETTIEGGKVTVDDGIGGHITETTPGGVRISDLTGKTTEIKQDSTGKTCITNTDSGPPSASAGIKIDGENGNVCIQGNFKIEQANGNKVFLNDNGIFVTDTASNTSWIMVEFDPSTGRIRVPGDATFSGNNVNKGSLEVCGDLILKGNITDTAGNVILAYDPISGITYLHNLFLDSLDALQIFTDDLKVFADAQVKGHLEVCSDLQLKGNITDTAGNPLIGFHYPSGSVGKLGNLLLPFGLPPGPNHVLTFDQFGQGQWVDGCSLCVFTEAKTASAAQQSPKSITAEPQVLKVQIDHPLDPKNKVLTHSAVTSPVLMNVYNGTITTNGQAEAVVKMPAYVEASNTDFRYQLTVIGAFAQAIVFKEMSNNQFVIKTDQPNIKVSWQLTGVRSDAYAQDNPVQVESAKTGQAKGQLLYTPSGKVATK